MRDCTVAEVATGTTENHSKPDSHCIAQYLIGLVDRVLVAHTSPRGSIIAGRVSRSTMWKTAFYACVLLLAPIGEQLSPSRLVKIVRRFLDSNGKAKPLDGLNPFTYVPCF